MKCPTCGVEMIERTGRYGDFFYCKDHGTISARGAKLIAAIEQMNAQTSESTRAASSPDLLHMVKVKSYELGQHTDDLGQLCEWIVDQNTEEDDHWMNVRPY